MAQSLTDAKVAKLTTPGFHRDYGDNSATGLYVQCTEKAKGGFAHSWVYRYVSPLSGKSRYMGLGPCEAVKIEQARDLAKAARGLIVVHRLDPIEHRAATQAQEREAMAREIASRMTFADCAKGYQDAHLSAFKNSKHRAQWKTSLARANAAFGKVAVGEIDVPILVKFLEPIWNKTPETGSRIRGRVEKVLDWAKARGFRQGENPARWGGHLEHVLGARPAAANHKAMPVAELPAFMDRLRQREAISARALEFTILTAARTGETLGAEWDEIDLKARTWTVPAARMKAGKEHVVPLSDRAVAILEALPRIDGEPYLFPGVKNGKSMSNMSMLKMLKALDGNGFTVHGFRSTFRDWAGDATSFDRETIEHALAHRIKDKAEAAYRRSSALSKRAKLMAAWSEYCAGQKIEGGNVVQIGAAQKHG